MANITNKYPAARAGTPAAPMARARPIARRSAFISARASERCSRMNICSPSSSRCSASFGGMLTAGIAPT